MRLDKSMVRTVLFSLTVVTMIIGVYQTVLQNDANAIRDNYWLFTFAFTFYLTYWYLGRKEKREPAAAAKPAAPAPRPGKATQNKRRRAK